MNASHQYCTFVLGEHLFGIEVRAVQEVIRHQVMTPVPLAPATIQGLINLRGQIVTAIDLRLRLDLPPRAGDARPTNVIVQLPDGAVSASTISKRDGELFRRGRRLDWGDRLPVED